MQGVGEGWQLEDSEKLLEMQLVPEMPPLLHVVANPVSGCAFSSSSAN